MKCRAAVLSAIACAVVLVAPAHATPYAGQFRYLSSGTLSVEGADGARWLLTVGATQSGSFESRPEQKLYIDLTRCVASACKTVGKWSRPLTANEVSISTQGVLATWTQPGGARLRTVLGGMNLDLTLNDDGSVGGAAFDSLGESTSPPGVRPQVEQYSYASGTVNLARLHCAVAHNQGVIGQADGADTIGDDTRDPRVAPPAKLHVGFLSGKRAPSC